MPGCSATRPIEAMSLADWNRVIGVNLTGQFLCAREAVREFKRRGMQPELSRALGKIICMSSVHQVIPWAGHANYAASKGGVALLMKTLAQELAPQRIRVNSIAPGAIRTPINRPAWETPEALARFCGSSRPSGSASPRTSPRRRSGSPPTPRTTSRARRCSWTAA